MVRIRRRAGVMMLSTVLDPELRKYEGKTFEEIGTEMGKDPRDAVMDLVIADLGRSDVIISIMREDDVRAALASPMMAIGTDSGSRAEDGPLSVSKSHPRAWGSFPRSARQVCPRRQRADARRRVRRFTSRAAWRVGMADRGILRAGMKADITIFDSATVRDVSTYDDPIALLRGHSSRPRQRPGCRVGRQDHRRAAGTGDPRPWISRAAVRIDSGLRASGFRYRRTAGMPVVCTASARTPVLLRAHWPRDNPARPAAAARPDLLPDLRVWRDADGLCSRHLVPAQLRVRRRDSRVS